MKDVEKVFKSYMEALAAYEALRDAPPPINVDLDSPGSDDIRSAYASRVRQVAHRVTVQWNMIERLITGDCDDVTQAAFKKEGNSPNNISTDLLNRTTHAHMAALGRQVSGYMPSVHLGPLVSKK